MINPIAMFTIPYIAPSLNRSLRQHWAARAKGNQFVQMLVKVRCPKVPRQKSGEIRHVTIIRFGSRLLDVDNLAGSAKGIVDALRYAGVIADDSPDRITLEFRQSRVPNGVAPYTAISIDREHGSQIGTSGE